MRLLQVAVLCLGAAASVWAQADVSTATMKGTVSDASGAVLVDAKVTVKSTERGIAQTTTTDGAGVYQVRFLQPGVYDLRVEAQGFKTLVSTSLALTVGQIAIQDVRLEVGAVTEQVAVTGEVSLIETERTQQSNTITRAQIANLPNVGRAYANYIYTLPGVSNSNAPRAQNPGFTFGTSGFSIGGSNGRNNLITVDGGENEYGSGQMRNVTLSIDSVQEFQVNRNAFAAEYGFTAGTAINIVTRSGTNQLHGSAYNFYRSQKTSARYFFDPSQRKAFDQQMYPGMTLGGPLARNKLFFFTSYEYIKSDAARFRAYTNNPALLGPSAAQSAYLTQLAAAADTNIRRIGGLLRSALTTGAGNYPDTWKLLTQNEGTFSSPGRVHTWNTRIDYQIGSNDQLSSRFTLTDSTTHGLGISNTEAPSYTTTLFYRDYTWVTTWNRTITSSLVNSFRVQLVPNNRAQTQSASPNSTAIIIPGIGNFGRIFSAPFNTFQDRYQFEDSLVWVRGRHAVKIGASYRPVKYHVINELWFGGQWNYASGTFPILLALPPSEQGALGAYNVGAGLPAAGPPAGAMSALQSFNAGLPLLFRQGVGTPVFKGWAKFLGTYVQDSWKITPRFTLDIGLRVDHDAEPSPPLSTYVTVSPRLGLAWDIGGRQKTVIRAGGGLFYSPVYYQVPTYTSILDDSGLRVNQVFRSPAAIFPASQQPAAVWALGRRLGKLPFTALTPQDLQTIGISLTRGAIGRVLFQASPDYENNYSGQLSVSIAREIVPNMTLEVAYQMYRGVHLQLPLEVNYRESGVDAGPGLGPRLVPIDPTITQNNVYSSIGNSIYHGMTSSLNKRFSRHVQFQVNYTFSKTIDNVTDFNSSFSAFLPTRLYLDRALSVFDVRHNFVASGVFESPFKAGPGNHPLARAFADIMLSPAMILRSGIPFTLRTGFDTNGDTHGDYDRPFAAPRNSGLGESLNNIDLRLTKQFYIKRDRGLRIEFIAEASNLVNHTNILAINDVVGIDPRILAGPYNLRGDPTLARTAPLGFRDAADARRVQFALKIAF